MSDTYSTHVTICAKFYELTLDSRAVGEFVFRRTTAVPGESVLFAGGMFDVAATLFTFGLQVTLVDYTDEMVALGKQRLLNCEIFIDHRAFSRVELAEHLARQGFSVLDQGDNFDATSFYTISQRSTG
jgi:hypothetical protein